MKGTFVVAIALFGACSSPKSGGRLDANGGGGSDAQAPNDGQLATPIKHVVVIVKENHTFDNYFGSFPGAEGTTHVPDLDGTDRLPRTRPIARRATSATSTTARSPTGTAAR